MAKTMNAREIIAKHNGAITESYMLVNNHGYVIKHRGRKYDVRRWRNCYGSDCGWGVMCLDGQVEPTWKSKLLKDLNDTELNTEW